MSRAGLALALLCALGAARALKRAESESNIVSPVPFTFAARYGRSPERLITPRHDRWMLSSRYGKRSSTSDEAGGPLIGKEKPPFLTDGQNPPFLGEIETPFFMQRGNDKPPFFKGGKERLFFKDEGADKELYCEYTGVMELYHCSKRRRSGLEAFDRKTDGSSSSSQIEEA